METILFDASAHLGQFCLSNERVRKGCKKMQASLSPTGKFSRMGMWNDLENGRADKTIWGLPRELQDSFYPLMDMFYSIINVQQRPIDDQEEHFAIVLQKRFPQLHLYSRYAIARGIVHGATEFHTLVEELLSDEVSSFALANGVEIMRPEADEEHSYPDALLEERYQTALAAFRALNIDPTKVLADKRAVRLA